MSNDKVQQYKELALNNANFQYSKAQRTYNKKRRAFTQQLNSSLQKTLNTANNDIVKEYTDSILRVLMGEDDGGAAQSETQLEQARTAMSKVAEKAIEQAQIDSQNTSMTNAIKQMAEQVVKDMNEW